jgi:predicted AAA+ superfamily ATPase
MVVDDILSKALFKDVVKRHNIKNTQLLDKIVDFVFDNVGNILSIASITKYMKNQKRSADPETVGNYLKYLEDAHIIHRAQRYDISGKRLLETNDKYYLGDHALQYVRRERRTDKIQGILENIVFMELKKRGYEVYVGTTNKGREVDFIANNKGEKVYVQVCMTMMNSESTREREFAPLLAIKDHYPKYVVTLDDYPYVSTDGVKGINLIDFLLKTDL